MSCGLPGGHGQGHRPGDRGFGKTNCNALKLDKSVWEAGIIDAAGQHYSDKELSVE